MTLRKVTWLVVSTQLKNMSQNENLPQIGVKIKNIWNHHLVTLLGINISHQIHHFWVDDFPFPKVGHVRSLEGKYNHNGTIISEWKTSYFSSMRNLIPCHTPPPPPTNIFPPRWLGKWSSFLFLLCRWKRSSSFLKCFMRPRDDLAKANVTKLRKGSQSTTVNQ